MCDYISFHVHAVKVLAYFSVAIGALTRLTLHVYHLLSSEVLAKQTTQSDYMLSALWVTGSLHVHSGSCLICCFDVCIKIISFHGIGMLLG